MSFNELQQHGFEYDEPLPPNAFSDTEFNEILRSIDGYMDPSDSMSFELDSVFPQSEGSSLYATETFSYDNGAYLPLHGLTDSEKGYEQPQGSESTNKLSSEDAVNVLEQWLEQHSHHPYPTKQEKALLAEQTELNITQVSTWFANARRRRKRGLVVCNRPLTRTSHDCLNGPQQTAHEQLSSLSPLDRWRNSPPEIEAAPLEAIMSAVTSSEANDLSDRNFELASFNSGDLQQSPSLNGNDARSQVSSKASGSALSNSSGSSAYSFGSNHSHGSFGRFYLNEPPRRRHRRRTKTASMLPKPPKKTIGGQRPYQCTFCTDTFRTKHDWTRHEKTLHLSLESFTCSPSGSTYNDPSDRTERCAFCDNPHPSESHVESHRFSICQQKPAAFRTFYRKDHLVQHLRLVHGVSHSIPSMETWKSQVTHVRSRCGFCGESFVVWSKRNDHIAQHFRKGALMKEWRGCRGLDPPVALAVENAMPPYLIGIESAGLDPFSASGLADKGVETRTGAAGQLTAMKSKPTSFEYLTARLTEFVHEVQATGGIVTDGILQKEARCIMYVDDDPWNQTAADNPEWLKLFKEGMGLNSMAGPSQSNLPNQPDGEDYSFCLPWSADPWPLFNPTTNSVTSNSSDMINACMTWSWQSPECLAEFRQHNMAACAVGPAREQGVVHSTTSPASSLNSGLDLNAQASFSHSNYHV